MKKYTYPADLIVKRLNEYLFKSGKSLYQFSKEACISLSTLKNLMNGHTKAPTIGLIIKIICELKIELTEFFDVSYFKRVELEETLSNII